MSTNHDRPWEERLEAGAEDDELLALAARLRRAGEATRATPPLAFQRQLRRDLLNQHAAPPRRGANVWRWVSSLVAVALLAVVVGLTWLSISSSGRPSFGGAANGEAETAIVSLPDGSIYLEMHGYSSALEALVPGEMLSLNGRWRIPANVANGADLTAFLQLRDEAGALVAQADGPLTSEYIETRNGREAWWFLLSLALPDNLPPGEYLLVTGLLGANGQRLPVFDQQVSDEIVIGTVTLGDVPVAQSDVAIVPPPPEGAAYLESSSYSAPDGLIPGGTVEFTGLWRIPTDLAIGADVMSFLHLRTADGVIIAESDGALIADNTTSGASRNGRAAWASQLIMAMPDDLRPGEYFLVTGLVDTNGQRLPVFDLTTGDEIVIGSFTTGQATFIDTNMTVLDVSPAAGSILTGTQPITFTVRLAYDGVAAPALLEVKINEVIGASGRGVATAQVTLETESGEVTVPVVLRPAQELNAPAELGLWLQLRADADSPPELIAMPEEHRWRYTP
jgi:hypothetical protein